ncbi:MAG: GNAT family N-acetyltransferase [Actinomycetota bacterium]
MALPPGDIEIGWWLEPQAWGKGYATEAAAITMDEGFSDQLAELVWARHTARNVASGRIMEKIGMTFVRHETSTQGGVPFRIYELRRDRWLLANELLTGAR